MDNWCSCPRADEHRTVREAQNCAYCNRLVALDADAPPTREAAAQARRESFRAAALPLMTWLAKNANPHAVAHVDSELAELLEGALVVPREL